jgi:hypothetical protein
MPAPKVDDEAVYEEKRPSPGTGNSSDDGAHNELPTQRQSSVAAAKLRNPLGGMTEEEVLRDVDAFIEARGLADKRETFHKGALMARVQNRPNGFEHIAMLSDEEKGWLRHEETHRWSQPFMLYFLVVLCAGSAIVQGMDQTAVNGAQVCDRKSSVERMITDVLQAFYFREFGIEGTENDLLQGLINGAPYLCSALIGCWSNRPLNVSDIIDSAWKCDVCTDVVSRNTSAVVEPSSSHAPLVQSPVSGWPQQTTGLTSSLLASLWALPLERNRAPPLSTLPNLLPRTSVAHSR